MPRVSFKTVGCRLNQAETAQIAARFAARGYQIVSFNELADVYVIHTCTITNTAERKSVRFARAARKLNPNAIIALLGCAVEINRDALLKQTGADLALGQGDKFALLDHVTALQNAHARGLDAPQSSLEMLSAPPLLPVFERTRAIVKIQDGCDFRCTYCIVPDARGRPHSRPHDAIVSEVKGLAENGFREIILTGANLGCYEDGPVGLVDLLRHLESITGLTRIRISSIESSTTERSVIDFMAQSKKLCHYIHLPLQSGDDRILNAMKRRYSVAQFKDLLHYAAARVPNIGIGTDVLVGFPGETDAEFQNTYDAISDMPLSNLHVFPYSMRPGTPAADMPGQLSRKEKRLRADTLIALGNAKRHAFARSFIGKEVAVLIENIDGSGCTATGWTSEYLEARIPYTSSTVNQVVAFHPTDILDDYLC